MASRRSQVATLTTNTPVARMLATVSLGSAAPARAGWRPLLPIITMGGAEAMALKKL